MNVSIFPETLVLLHFVWNLIDGSEHVPQQLADKGCCHVLRALMATFADKDNMGTGTMYHV